MAKINMTLLPIKAHYFFFMAAMGPILPQLPVIGRQLGISPDVMGLITSVLPLLYILAKPTFGFIADYFSNYRKWIFISIILLCTLCYAGFYFVPQPHDHPIGLETEYHISILSNNFNQCPPEILNKEAFCKTTRKVICTDSERTYNDLYLKPLESLDLNKSNSTINATLNYQLCFTRSEIPKSEELILRLVCTADMNAVPDCLYNTATFWSFLLLMSIGTICFNVANCISDAVCFDMLGEAQEMKYGVQRAFGTIGFGLAALVAGIAVDLYTESTVKSFTPALIVMLICSGFDVFSAAKLKLPSFTSPNSILKEVGGLVRQPAIAIFLAFATLAGVFDSFIIYYMFWHLEEVAEKTGYMESIKLIEGCVVAAECLGGEILFFFISGKILKKIGFIHCLSVCFLTYSIRLVLISLIPNPWWLVGVELFMQGSTYALCYACIVAYASAIAPPGTSATVQGLVAGMDDGLGYAIGSLFGGQMYKYLGGAKSFQIFSGASFITCIAHILLRPDNKPTSNSTKQGYRVPEEQKISS